MTDIVGQGFELREVRRSSGSLGLLIHVDLYINARLLLDVHLRIKAHGPIELVLKVDPHLQCWGQEYGAMEVTSDG